MKRQSGATVMKICPPEKQSFSLVLMWPCCSQCTALELQFLLPLFSNTGVRGYVAPCPVESGFENRKRVDNKVCDLRRPVPMGG